MYIKSLRVKGFRSFQDMSISFERGITTVVGENNTGKSSIPLALVRLLSAIMGGVSITQDDYPFSILGPMEIIAVISLSDAETEEYLRTKLIPSGLSASRMNESPLHDWLRSDDNTVTLTLTSSSNYRSATLRWNKLSFVDNLFSLTEVGTRPVDEWKFIAKPFAEGGMDLKTFNSKLEESNQKIVDNMTVFFGDLVLKCLKITNEFPAPPTLTNRTGNLETMSGAETASVLLNLKNHHIQREKARYRQVINALKQFFPRYDVDAVEKVPGSSQPDIQFSDTAHPEHPLSISQMSAGVQQITSLITNLVAREGLILFIQHPENLLHPHAKRSLHSLLTKASESNQIIVVTHDPYFIDPGSPSRLRRVWQCPKRGTHVLGAWSELENTEEAQIKTALRHLGDREIVFARAVLLVEDESLYEFLLIVAPKLGYDLDTHGVSILSTGGHGGHKPYHTVLRALGIPHINFRDKPWGNNPNFPPERFFSLGEELEKYLDHYGLEKVRAEANRGGSHRRGAAATAVLLKRDEIPLKFDEVLNATVRLATGHQLE